MNLRTPLSAGLALAFLLLTAGCATGPVTGPVPVQESGEAAPPGSVSRPSEPAGPTVSAVVALQDAAQQQVKAGNPQNAAEILERALGIEPRNPELWHRLAAVRLQQGRYPLAESLALKSNALGVRDRALLARNWQLIARIRRQAGDAAGAVAAAQRAKALTTGL